MLPITAIILILLRIITRTATLLFKQYHLLQLYQTLCLILRYLRPTIGIPVFTIITGMTLAVLFPGLSNADIVVYGGFIVCVEWYVYRAAGMRVGGVLWFVHDRELRRGMEG